GRSLQFRNWVDTDTIYPIEPATRERVTALYSGTTGAKQGLELLIEAARMLRSNGEIELLICGNDTGDLQRQASDLPNVRFIPLQPPDRLNVLLNEADIHLLPQKPSVADLVMPSKLLGMASSGRPVIATVKVGTEVARAVSSFGIVVPPEDPAALADAI